MKKIATIAMLGGAIVSAGMALAPMAAAAPGVSVNVGGHEVGVGDAHATADKRNVSLAVNTGLTSPSSVAHAGGGNGNTAVAIDGQSAAVGTNNHTFAAVGVSQVVGADNNVVTVAGASYINGHNNFVVNGGGVAQNLIPSGQLTTDPGEISVSVCGTSFSGQAARIKTSNLAC